VDFSDYYDSSFPDITHQFIEQAQVAFTAGEPFGGPDYRNFVRINFATNSDIIIQAFKQLSDSIG
jgi:bifunctional pyridoxal-dependent enzyme with beta-cystathionase and maltose regulon repressor activities